MQHWAPPQYSADGRWWWDGYRWIPCALPLPTSTAWDWQEPEGGRRGTPRSLWISIVGLVLLLLIAVGPAAIAWVQAQV